jgi:lactoylglutathione lyase
MSLRAFPVVYAQDVDAEVAFYERLGFRRHYQLPAHGETGYVGLSRKGSAELAVTHATWASDRHDISFGQGARFEMYVYCDDLSETLAQLTETGMAVLRDPEDMPWGERIATVLDSEGNPVALCQQTPQGQGSISGASR